MKYSEARCYADPERAARRIVEIASTFEPVQPRPCRRRLLCRFLDAGNKEASQAQLTGVQKRQGTKSREVWHRLGSECYGDLMLASISMMKARVTGRLFPLQRKVPLPIAASPTSR